MYSCLIFDLSLRSGVFNQTIKCILEKHANFPEIKTINWRRNYAVATELESKSTGAGLTSSHVMIISRPRVYCARRTLSFIDLSFIQTFHPVPSIMSLSLRSTYIDILDDDALLYIFTINANMFLDEDALVTTCATSLVCRRWRNLMLDTPSLWAKLIDMDWISFAVHYGISQPTYEKDWDRAAVDQVKLDPENSTCRPPQNYTDFSLRHCPRKLAPDSKACDLL